MKSYLLKNWRNCIERKDLLWQMVTSQLISGQKDLMLGYVWWILEPLLFTLVYWLLVSVIFKRGGPNYAVFILCGLVPYRAFSISFSQSVTSVSSKFGLISQVNFPRLFLPLTTVLVNHIKLIFGFIVVILFSYFLGVSLNYKLFYLIIPFLVQAILVSGLAMGMSVLGVYFRDLRNFMQFVMRVLLYFSPVLYSLERIPEKYRDIYLLNPIAPLLITYRDIIIYGSTPNLKGLSIVIVEAIFLFLLGYIFFSRHDRKLLKHI